MSTIQRKVPREELMTRLAKLEEEHTHLVEELAILRAERPTITEHLVVQAQEIVSERSEKPRWETIDKRKSRRNILSKAFWTAATIVGAGALLQRSAGIARADGNEGPTTFTGTVSGTPAITSNHHLGLNRSKLCAQVYQWYLHR